MRVLTLFKIPRSKRGIFKLRNQSAQEGSNSIIFPSENIKGLQLLSWLTRKPVMCMCNFAKWLKQKEVFLTRKMDFSNRFRKDLEIYLQIVQTIASKCIILVRKKMSNAFPNLCSFILIILSQGKNH